MKSFLFCTVVFTSFLTISVAQKSVKCWAHNECSPKECCAGLSPRHPGLCIHQPQLKERCNPLIKPGAMECPCRLGMMCSVRNVQNGFGKCQYITINPDEVDENGKLPWLS